MTFTFNSSGIHIKPAAFSIIVVACLLAPYQASCRGEDDSSDSGQSGGAPMPIPEPPLIRESAAAHLPSSVDENVYSRFRDEAPKGWELLKRELSGFEVAFHHSEYIIDNDVMSDDMTLFSIRGNGKDYLMVKKPSERFLEIFALNDKNCFVVTKKEQAEDFSLLAFSPRETPDGGSVPIGTIRESSSHLGYLWSCWWIPMEELLLDQDMELIGISEASDGGASEPIVSVAYRYIGEDHKAPYHLQNGVVYWARLLPSRHWAVVRSGVIGIDDGTTLLEINVALELQDWKGLPFPKSALLQYNTAETDVVLEYRYTRFETPADCSKTPAEFYLNSFGIEEPVEVVPSTTWGLRSVIVAVHVLAILILLAVIVLRRKSGMKVSEKTH